MISVDGSLFLQIINFLVLIWALNIVLYKPIRGILAQRREKFTGLEQGIDTLNRDAREQEEAFAAGIKNARNNGLKEKEALVSSGTEVEKQIIHEINQKAQADLVEVREKIAKDTEAVRASLLKEVDKFADAIGQKILGRAV